MARYFQKIIPDYVTKGVAEKVDPLHLAKCIESLEELIRSGTSPDYLQVFRLDHDETRNVMILKHSQEQPDWTRTVEYQLNEGVQPYVGKLYCIDEVDHVIMLLAEEY